MKTSCKRLAASLLATSAWLAIPAYAQDARNAPEENAADDIIVTGTLRANAPPSVSVSTIAGATLDQSVPNSAVDLLRNVPGVYVNSALGEVRNIVYSRGISVNSNEAATGYYYVSLQEDGLPVTNVTLSNYTPDFFYRQDLSLDRLEALRGGTAVVTGANAPGGIFNYISKTGRSNPGVALQTRLGLEGNGRNPYYRADAFFGGRIGNSDVYYSVDGFYRRSTGPRDPGYVVNRGGQIKANLLWDYGAGSILLYGKYQNDRNGFQTFLPARDFNNPGVVSDISRYGSFSMPANSVHNYVRDINGSTQVYDPRNLVFSKSVVAGLKFEHDFGDGLMLRNNIKYVTNRINYRTQAVAFSIGITDATLNTNLNTNRDGVYSYRDVVTGDLLAEVRLAGGVRTILTNNLPNQQILAGGVVSQAAYNYNPGTQELMDQITLSKTFSRGSITVGGFFGYSKFDQSGGGAGVGLSTMTSAPRLMQITLLTPGGVTQQVTNAAGFASIGQRFSGVPFYGKQWQTSVFAGGDYEIANGLILEAAARYENIRNSGRDFASVANPRGNDVTYGGLDGDPNTLFDNYAVTYASPGRYKYSLGFLSYSAAATYKFDDQRKSLYVRFSKGKKAPDVGFYTGSYDTLAKLQNIRPIPQVITQIEGGFRYNGSRLRAAITPFYSKVDNVANAQLGINADGSSYTPAPVISNTYTYGTEFEGDVDIVDKLNLRVALTLQKGRSENFAVYVFGAPGPADDVLARVPDGKLDNLPDILGTTTLRFRPSKSFTTYATWRYIGERPANRYNAFDLPGYHEVDIGATFTLWRQVTLGFNINNLFNSRGVLSWAPSGALVAALDRQSLTPASVAANPNQLFSVIENQPRSFFMTLGVKF